MNQPFPFKILVIVVTYNGLKWLKECLTSVTSSRVPADLFVVDNCSTDNSVEFIRENFPKAIIIENNKNLGFGRANNLGLKYALDNDYDYVYLLNQDAWVEPETFEKLIHTFQHNPKFGILSPLQCIRTKAALDPAFSYFCPPLLVNDSLFSKLKEVYSTEFVAAAHWMISKQALQTVGFFSPTFTHYGEDDNYVHRLQYHGYKIGIVPSSRCVHDHDYKPQTSDQRQYRAYTAQLALMSNPFAIHPILRLFELTFRKFLRDPNISNKYYLRILKEFMNIIKNRKKTLHKGAFI